MVIYYSLGGKTRVYAEKIADALGDKVSRLEGVSKSKNVLIAALSALVTGGKVKTLPIIDGEPLYLCAPIWAGKPAPFVAYFLKRTNLSGKKIHFILTCADPNPAKYVSALKSDLSQYGGNVYAFCTQNEGSVDANVQSVISQFASL